MFARLWWKEARQTWPVWGFLALVGAAIQSYLFTFWAPEVSAGGYAYVALALPAFVLGDDHENAQSALFAGAAFSFMWFLASLRAKLDRYDPDGFFAGVVAMGGASTIALQAAALLLRRPQFAALAAGCAAVVIIGASLAALRARKVGRWFGRAGLVGGIATLGVGMA